MQQLIAKIRALGWPELEYNGNITIQNSEKIVLESNPPLETLYFLYRKEVEGVIRFEDQYSKLKKIVFPTEFDIAPIVTKELKLRHYKQLNDVFKFNDRNINTVIISEDIDNYEVSEAEQLLKITPECLQEILNAYTSFYDGAGNYYSKYLNYKETEFQRSYFGIIKEKKTLTSKGEFTFLIDRFNLQTKKTTADFEKYLNENDLLSLEELNLKLIQKEIFGTNYLTKLNDYFIKVKLQEIIKLGREIQDLKSPNLKTAIAKRVISKLEPGANGIKQMETVWQKYFEKYLSFLIFSYQALYPKIELNVDLKKKYPDFIGINHFGGVDIIEIKTHLKIAVTKDPSHDNYAFSSEMSKSIIQTINYMDALIQEKIKKKTQREDIKGKILEGNIYRPRGIIIISSYDYLAKGIKPVDVEFENVRRDFTKLRHGLHNIQILTFNELLDMAERYKDNIVK